MRVLTEQEWVKDGHHYDPVAYLEMPVEEIAARCGFETIDLPGDWPGRVIGQLLKDNMGNQYYLMQTTDGPDAAWNRRTAVCVGMIDMTRTLRSPGSLTNSFVNAMKDLKIPLENVMHLHKDVDADRANWILGMGLDSKVERFALEFNPK